MVAKGLGISPQLFRTFVLYDMHDCYFNLCACRKRKLRESSMDLYEWMIIRVNFLGRPQLPLRFRHPTTSMHFATRSLLPITRCKPAQYASKRGFHAFQCAPRLTPRLGVAPSLRVFFSDVPPFACRRMLHASSGEPLLVPWSLYINIY